MKKDMKWYVLNVFNTREKKIKETIEKELKLQNMENFVGNILTPMEKVYKVKNSKKVQSEKILYPGYILVECDMNGELLRTIKRINGVISFLGGTSPVPMTNKEIENVLGKVEALEESNEIGFESTIIIGQRVDIVSGPFSTFTGTVTSLNPEKNKLMVDVSIFNRKTPLELTYEQVVNSI